MSERAAAVVRGEAGGGGVLAVVLVTSSLGLVPAAPAEAATARYKCKAYFRLDKLGRPETYSCLLSSGRCTTLGCR